MPSRCGAAPLPQLQRSSQGSPALPLPWAGPQVMRHSPGPFLGSWGGEETKPWWEGRATRTWSLESASLPTGPASRGLMSQLVFIRSVSA